MTKNKKALLSEYYNNYLVIDIMNSNSLQISKQMLLVGY